jgi:hypothetical protein
MTQPVMTNPVFTARRRFAPHMTSGERGLTYANVRKGADFEVMWCNESGPSSVSGYRASGWQIVDPKNVEMLDYGQEFPTEKDFGVFIEFDKKSDRVRSPLTDTKGMQMVLMCMPGSRRRQIREEERILMDRNAKKMVNTEALENNSYMTTEASTTTENIKVGEQ